MEKSHRQKEFNIPIKVFGSFRARQRENTPAQEEQNNDIAPIMIDDEINDSRRKLSPKVWSGDMQPAIRTGEIDVEKTKEHRRRSLGAGRLNSPMQWLEKKNKNERIKLMWAIVGSFMAIIIFVWTIFLKYNIMLEKLSLKQLEKEEEWEDVKENFEKSMDDFQKMLSEVKNGTDQSQPVDNKQETPEIKQTEDGGIEQSHTENKDINLTDENIEKLKEKLMEKK